MKEGGHIGDGKPVDTRREDVDNLPGSGGMHVLWVEGHKQPGEGQGLGQTMDSWQEGIWDRKQESVEHKADID